MNENKKDPLKNFEQVRAAIALEAAGKIGTGSDGGKAVAKKVPAQIIQNGLLSSLAFAIEKVKNDKLLMGNDGYYQKDGGFEKCGYANTFVSVMKDLCSTKCDFGLCNGDLEDWFSGLCAKGSDELRLVTSEALAYLNYLRRFARPEKSTGTPGEGGNV